MLSQRNDIDSILEQSNDLVLICDRWLLCLKIVRQLIFSGYASDSRTAQVIILSPLLTVLLLLNVHKLFQKQDLQLAVFLCRRSGRSGKFVQQFWLPLNPFFRIVSYIFYLYIPSNALLFPMLFPLGIDYNTQKLFWICFDIIKLGITVLWYVFLLFTLLFNLLFRKMLLAKNSKGDIVVLFVNRTPLTSFFIITPLFSQNICCCSLLHRRLLQRQAS